MALHGFRLLTLGRLALEGAEGDPAAEALRKQRRKLAVLAVLALSQERLTRERLVQLFWGDQPESRGRHSLSEALSHLRRVLGPHAITARGLEVVLSHSAPLAVDALEFTAAVRAGHLAEALELYAGPFLDGADTAGSHGLEAWIEAQRQELERSFARVCEQEYVRLRGLRQWEEAATLAHRWLQADPLSEPAGLALLGALEGTEAADADARALREYRALRTRLLRDYGLTPGARLEARAAVLMERLAGSGAPDAAVEGTAAVAAPTPVAPASNAAANVAPATPAATNPPEAPGAAAAIAAEPADAAAAGQEAEPGSASPADELRVRRRRKWAIGVVSVLAVFCGWVVLRPRHFVPRPPPPSNTIAVLPFSVAGPPEYAYLGEGVVDLLSVNLDGAGPYRAVNPQAMLNAAHASPGTASREPARQVAARLGAGLYLVGDVVVAGNRLRMSATLLRRGQPDRVVAEANVEGKPDELFQLVDRLTTELLAASGSPVPVLGRLAAVTTKSLPALKHYLEGESNLRRGLYATAFEDFRAASQDDTTFALAHFRVAQAGNWAVPPAWSWDSILARSRLAAARAGRLAPRARLLVEAYADWAAGGYDEAETSYRAVVRTYPDDVEAWTGLGEVMFHTNPMRGRAFLESGPPFERVLALEPDNIGALTHLLRIRLRERRPAAVDSLVARLDALVPEAHTAEYHVLRAFANGGAQDQTRALERLRRTGDEEQTRVTAHRLAIYAGDDRAAARVLPLLLNRGLSPDVQAHARIWLAELEVTRGRWRAAEPHLAAAAALDSAVALEERGLLLALPFAPAGAAPRAAVEAALGRWAAARTPPAGYPWLGVYDGLHEVIRQYLLGLLQLRRGDRSAVLRRADALEGAPGKPIEREFARGMAESLRAHVAAEAGEADALAHFDAAHLR
ncbi:MAG TPA: BTAD domain-containing putative transcriptional regulator, partial [Longimicrobiales bacterium]